MLDKALSTLNAWQSKCVALWSAFALALVIAPNYALASPNLITNGDFESGTTGWTSLSCGAGLEISNSPGTYGIPAAPNGAHFVEVECNSLVPTSTADYVQQTVTTTVGETYIVSAQATTRAAVNSQDKMIINAAGANIASVTTGNTWVKYNGSFVASGTSSVIRYLSNGSVTGFTQPGDSNGLMLDDAQVQELTVSPTSATTAEDTPITFNSGGGNSFQVATNSTAATLTVSFAVANGKLTLTSTTGLTFTIGANGTASFTFTGTAAAINTALNTGITYAPTADYNGADTISFTVTAGAASDTDTVPVTITPVADIVADSVTTTENSAIVYNAITGTNGASADNFENTPTAVSVTAPSHGTAVASGVTVGQITYTPTAGWFGTDTFTYTVTSGGVTETATETVTVVPLNPLLTLSKTTFGGIGSFTFTGNNGWSSQTIATVTVGTAASGSQQTLTAAGTTTTITEALAAGYQLTSATCTDTNNANTGNPASFGSVSGNVLTIPAANVIKGAAISCAFNNTKTPTMKVQKLTRGKSGGPFSFTQTGLTSTPAAITTSTLAAEPTTPTAINATIGTAVTLNETVDPNYATAGVSCADANSAITGNAAPTNSATASVTVPAANIKAGADYICLFTNDRIPTVKVQKTTLGGFGGPFSFTTTNMATTPGSITTVAAGTPTPAAPTANNVSTISTPVTINEPAIGGFFLSNATCTDANSAVTGNSGSFTSLAGSTLTIPGANVKAGADFTCVFSNTKGAPNLTVVKTASPSGPFSAGQTITYTYGVTNSGNVSVANVTVGDTHNGTGVFTGPNSETLTTDVAPAGDSSDVTANNGVWSVLGVGDTVTFTATYVVTQHDVDFLQ